MRPRTKRAVQGLVIGFIVLLLFPCGGCRRPRRTLSVFAAASLNMALVEFEKVFERQEPDIDVRVEASGSLVAARKVSEYKKPGDLVISADKRVIDSLLIPDFADWQVVFLSNEIVLAYSENSRHAAQIDADNWPLILLNTEVRVARVDQSLGPLGYQTLLVWKLADIHYQKRLGGASLFESLSKKVTRKMIRPDAAELLPVLGTEADYIFVYRNMAKDHNLKHILLPPEVNLSSRDHVDVYSRASVVIPGSPGSSATLIMKGEPILYSLTIPRDAPNFRSAVSFASLLLGPDGGAMLRRHGFTPVSPPRFHGPREVMPGGLRGIVAESTNEPETAK